MSKHGNPRERPPAWEQLSSWIAVVETGSVSSAAARLGISQAGVSQHVRQLEQTFDTPLLDRSTRPARATASGQRLYEHALALRGQAEQMAEGVRALSRAKRALVRMGCVDSFAATIGPQLVRGLIGRMHRVRMCSGLSPDLLGQFQNHQLDLLMTTAAPAHEPGIAQLPLFTEQYVVALPADQAVDPSESLLALSRGLPFMNYSLRSQIGRQIEAYLHGLHPGIESAFEFDATDPLLALVREGLGFALTTPLCLWQSRYHAGAVRILPLSAFQHQGRSCPPLTRRFSLVHREAEMGSLPREVADLVRIVVRELQRDIGAALALPAGALAIDD
ncbi:MAG: LysR family transcriptional regulator [Rhodoferax sp.]|nr:LysR family transcriptional regulator [Rhodoferax sp.]